MRVGDRQEPGVAEHPAQPAVHGPGRPGEPVAGDHHERAVRAEDVLEPVVGRARHVRRRRLGVVHPDELRAHVRHPYRAVPEG